MKKFIFISVTICLLIVGGMVYMLNKTSSAAEALDVLQVEAVSPLTTKEIKIEYGFNTLSRKSDVELFKNRDRYTVLFDGVMKDTLKSQYGENDFLVTYDSTYYLSFRQVKSWGKSAHDYNFVIHLHDSIPTLKVHIQGEDSMAFDMPMIPIAEASNYVVNTPIDSTGAIYKFRKLANPELTDEQIAKNKKEEEELIKKMNKLFIQ